MVLLNAMTEKRKPSHDLQAIKAAFSTTKGLNATGAAIKGATLLGFGRREMVETIQTMERNTSSNRRPLTQIIRLGRMCITCRQRVVFYISNLLITS